ncbi:rhodanese-like domain-containing protein [Desulfovibrio sp. MES5]|uniref:rhodanese-like domain-containing protein n=1 Tax=Desulfovibrio sp. MES5 TaxID=1899016 RepID=UPI0025C3A4E4|nr:rhodanese-like domain-containing protein [Desulfovibrio sp. MES5]
MSTVQSMTAKELHSMDLRQALIVDVRTPMEYVEKRLAMPTALAPLLDLNPRDTALRNGVLADTPIITLCHSGSRAKTAAEKFAEAGFNNVRFLEGGLDACQKEGFATVGAAPATTGGSVPSLEKQVRLAAGLLILLFVLLGFFVHPGFYLGALFVGAGLTVSGLTNWCGMAMLLMYAPWNRQGASCSSGGACPIGGGKGGKSPGASCQ